MIMKLEFKERVSLDDAFEFTPQYLLIAGPSCGKSTLQQNTKGIVIHDSDEIIESFFPEWWTDNEMPPNIVNYKAVAWLMRFMNAGSNDCWVTNMWGQVFLETLFEKVKYKKVIFVYREDPAEIREIFLKLGKKPDSIKTLTQWVDDHEKFAYLVSDRVIRLKRGEYLSDVVTPTLNGWRMVKRTK